MLHPQPKTKNKYLPELDELIKRLGNQVYKSKKVLDYLVVNRIQNMLNNT